jgi:hypothetical protein
VASDGLSGNSVGSELVEKGDTLPISEKFRGSKQRNGSEQKESMGSGLTFVGSSAEFVGLCPIILQEIHYDGILITR